MQVEEQPRGPARWEEAVTASNTCFPATGRIEQKKLLKYVCQKPKVTQDTPNSTSNP